MKGTQSFTRMVLKTALRLKSRYMITLEPISFVIIPGAAAGMQLAFRLALVAKDQNKTEINRHPCL